MSEAPRDVMFSSMGPEQYLRSQGAQFFLSDLIRYLSAVVSPATAVEGSDPAGGRVSTPLTGSGPSVPSIGSSTAPPTPQAIPPASPQGAQSNATSQGVAAGGGSAVALLQNPSLTYNFDEVLHEMCQFYKEIYSGSHIAYQSAPYEYIVSTRRSRAALSCLAHRCLLHVLPSIVGPFIVQRSMSFMSPSSPPGATTGSSGTLATSVAVEVASMILNPMEAKTAVSVDTLGSIDCKELWLMLIQLHCGDFPRHWLDTIVKRAALAPSTAHKKLYSTTSLASAGFLPQGYLFRAFLLHMVCKELVEDLQVAYPSGAGGTMEKVRSDMMTWRRAFERWGLEGAWRCGPNRSSQVTSTYAVEPYPPLKVLQDVFGQVNFGAVTMLDVDHICTLMITSDLWFLWCLDGLDGSVAAVYM